MLATLLAAVTMMPTAEYKFNVIPRPAMTALRSESFAINADTTITSDSDPETAILFRKYFSPATGFAFPSSPNLQNAVTLKLSPRSNEGPESYRIFFTSWGINVHAPTRTGLFYGLQTLRQLYPKEIFASTPQNIDWTLPAIDVIDKPRFKWRGIMLDVARHFTEKQDLKKFIDALALHKINTLHLHLTDDQGWRIEIKKYPRLTEVGSIRKHTVIGHNTQEYDGIPHGGFYTQDDLREIVAYAKDRHITIVPEIDMPGHMVAAIAAYPELGDGKPAEVFTRWGVESRVLNTSEKTVQFCKDVLTEVMDIFPSEFIHIGGDECPKTQWENDPAEQQRMKERGLKDEHELQSWFIQQMEDHLHQNGRRLIGWDEILEGGLPKRSAVMSWRGTSGGLTAANLGQDVVMTPTSHMYLDYYQGPPAEEPEAIGGFVPLEKVYSFNPHIEGLSRANQKHILGVQGNIWTEYMKTYSHREYMAFPRACAVAEIGWTPQASRNFNEFLTRLPVHLERLKALNVNFRPLKDKEVPAGVWVPGTISTEWREVRWPLVKSITESGNYRITFMYTQGAHRLDIHKAAIWVNGTEVAEDAHEGTTGGSHRGNDYRFDNIVVNQGDVVELRATVRTDGGTDSYGNIYVVKL